MLTLPKDSEGTFRSSSQVATCLPHTAEVHTVPLIVERQAGINFYFYILLFIVLINFYSLWFNPTGNRAQINRFRSRRSIHLATER